MTRPDLPDVAAPRARPQRTCVGCKKRDDHPRHDDVLQVQPELRIASWHKDCHAIIAGCAQCVAETAGAEGKTGEAMRQHVLEFYAKKKG